MEYANYCIFDSKTDTNSYPEGKKRAEPILAFVYQKGKKDLSSALSSVSYAI